MSTPPPNKFPPGQNPREVFENHVERGPERHYYTYADLAKLYGVKLSYIRQLVKRKRFDPNDLESICRYWLYRAGVNASEPPAEEAPEEAPKEE